jgi:hypothetical protein
VQADTAHAGLGYGGSRISGAQPLKGQLISRDLRHG